MISIPVSEANFKAIQLGWRNYVVRPLPGVGLVPRLETCRVAVDDGAVLPEMEDYRVSVDFIVEDVQVVGDIQILTLFQVKDTYRLNDLVFLSRRGIRFVRARLQRDDVPCEHEPDTRWVIQHEAALCVLRDAQAIEQQRLSRDRGRMLRLANKKRGKHG